MYECMYACVLLTGGLVDVGHKLSVILYGRGCGSPLWLARLARNPVRFTYSPTITNTYCTSTQYICTYVRTDTVCTYCTYVRTYCTYVCMYIQSYACSTSQCIYIQTRVVMILTIYRVSRYFYKRYDTLIHFMS